MKCLIAITSKKYNELEYIRVYNAPELNTLIKILQRDFDDYEKVANLVDMGNIEKFDTNIQDSTFYIRDYGHSKLDHRYTKKLFHTEQKINAFLYNAGDMIFDYAFIYYGDKEKWVYYAKKDSFKKPYNVPKTKNESNGIIDFETFLAS